MNRFNKILIGYTGLLILLLVLAMPVGVKSVYAEESLQEEISEELPEAVKKADGTIACEGILYKVSVKATKTAAGEFTVTGFEGKTIKNIKLPEKISYNSREYIVTAIEDYAFYNRNIVTVELPGTLKQIGTGAFAGSDKLTTLSFAENASAALTVGDYAFFECDLLENINFSADKNIVKLGKAAFAYTAVKKLVLPDALKSIEAMAFYMCSGLKKVSLGANVKKIGTEAFAGCSAKLALTIREELKYLIYSEGCFYSNEGKSLINGDFAQGTVTILSGVEKLPAYCFEGNTRITKLIVPEGVKVIGECALKQCTALKSVKLPSTLKTIESYAFYGCSHLEGITIPAGVTAISGNPFMYCPRLATIKVSSENTSFKAKSNMLFSYDMETLWAAPGVKDSVKLPSATRYMMPFAFCGNTLIKKVTFNKGFVMPGLGAFYDCKSLSYVYIPNRSIDFSIDAWVVDEDSAEFCGIFHNCADGLEISLPYSENAGAESSIEQFIMQHCDSSAVLTQRS